MTPAREMTNKKSISPLQPFGWPPKSGCMPMSGNAVLVVELPELLSTDPPPVELFEVVDELPLVEVDSPELVSAGKVVTPGVVKLVEDPPGSVAPNEEPQRGSNT